MSKLPRGCLAALTLFAMLGCSEEQASTPALPTETLDSRFTQPGTELKLGETAVIPVPKKNGEAELTIDELEKGTTAQLRRLGMTDFSDTGGEPPTPYFLRVRITWVSGDSPILVPQANFNAWSGDQFVDTFRADVIEPKQPCAIGVFKAGTVLGSTVKSCVTFLLDPGMAPIDRITFTSRSDGPHQLGNGDELTWNL